MAIQGLKNPEVRATSDHVGAAVEALNMLGLVEDNAQVIESVTADFAALDDHDISGEPFIQLPRSVITLPEMIKVLDSGQYSNGREYPDTYVYENLWVPGTQGGSYRKEEIGNLGLGQVGADWPVHGRLAVHDSDNEEEPLLHFLNTPFDEKYADAGQETQLSEMAKVIADHDVEFEDYAMAPLNTMAVAMIALTRRIKGESMPMEWGIMRDATLPRKTVDGDSVVGRVRSLGGQLGLDWSGGDAIPGVGVGLSVGPKELEPQVS